MPLPPSYLCSVVARTLMIPSFEWAAKQLLDFMRLTEVAIGAEAREIYQPT